MVATAAEGPTAVVLVTLAYSATTVPLMVGLSVAAPSGKLAASA